MKMTSKLNCYGIIPARYASSRFPGKPLAKINGQPMFWHVYQRASRCRELQQVVLATDDARIYAAAEQLKVPVVMTAADHVSGSDRVLEAAHQLNVPADAIVVNIQGDEPLLEPAMLGQLVAPFQKGQTQVATLARQITAQEAQNSDIVKVVFSLSGRAIYFSRSTIPYPRGSEPVHYGHIGLYAFKMQTLERFVSMPASRLEQTEKLEQLRLLENDIPIHVRVTAYESIGVDRPEDIDSVCRLLNSRPDTDKGS